MPKLRNLETDYLVKDTGYTSDCWLWQRSLTTTGYGQIKRNGIYKFVHRLAYEKEYGPIADGLVIDHLCRQRSCIRPDHLEAVTHQENLLRGETIAANHAKRKDCRNGHSLEGDNLYMTPNGRRNCRKCRSEAMKRYSKRKRENIA